VATRTCLQSDDNAHPSQCEGKNAGVLRGFDAESRMKTCEAYPNEYYAIYSYFRCNYHVFFSSIIILLKRLNDNKNVQPNVCSDDRNSRR
jgi:hypothetical protein